ncbi:pseudouridine synthase [Magnetospirillum gryphiswaldense]|uniref:Pseudouridine synthase n=1 Tax=Magnetospirillum gryphiswaldense TaxID=55518 RepID=A4U4J5_9PROT|nr:16S rRNA pseudouridine(516) synthase [Magnetospirillum gryphiswaldense]AVM72630.1 Ribosomal small subunit pseudouridine synthase A [Magnetospirillum gryphiswaldense MSR-1]AVM76533.1 Ribosomal small subunit pseudouridine synthase A [Magnetospirillum gryphiswaldense]CAM77802.1 Ribosomal small subunit pseudouridylate synthase [Magnetospirillum gryphiswaldense MSR-1]
MRLVRLIANLGYGSQRDIRFLLRDGRVRHADGRELVESDKVAHDDIRVDGEPLDPPAGLVIMLHKPAGYTCSSSDPGRIVYELLPPRFMHRNPVLAPVGRLDRDTTGLLLLTDDGKLLHRLTSPRHHVPKTYDVTLDRPLEGTEAEIFASGTLMLRSEKTPLAPAQLQVLGPNQARLTLHEGRYHQVKRMFAAVGNHVVSLHRAGLGPLTLGDLPEGQWRVMAAEELTGL